jgi:hypothetical protein
MAALFRLREAVGGRWGGGGAGGFGGFSLEAAGAGLADERVTLLLGWWSGLSRGSIKSPWADLLKRVR